MELSCTPSSIKMGGAYKPKNPQLSIVPLPDNCVMKPIFQYGSLPFQHTHIETYSTHKHPTITFELEIFLFVKCWRISSQFCPATWKCHQITTKSCTLHQRTCQLVDSGIAMKNVNKLMNFNRAIMVTWLFFFHDQNLPNSWFQFVLP